MSLRHFVSSLLLVGTLDLHFTKAAPADLSSRAEDASDSNAGPTDYVIIGGGPSGFVVAEYLTRSSNARVTLLDAGPDLGTDPDVNTPGKLIENDMGIDILFTQPDPNLGGRTPDLGQGRAFGGGSAVNDMIHCRGASSVFDEWAKLSGNTGLSWTGGMFEAFKATTTYQDEASIKYHQAVNTSSFGNGPLAVSRQRELFALDQNLFSVMQSTLHVPEIDFASGQGIGVSQGLNTIRASNRTRSYAYNTFGYIANTRKNFKALPNSVVSKIGFNGTTATSVTYNDTASNKLITLKAKEIIVAAGAVRSPQLLMLSGVGPAATLSKYGIPVVKDVAQVGQNLVDHHNALVQYSVKPQELTDWQYDYNATIRTQADAAYARNGDGLLGTQLGDVVSAVRLPDSAFAGTSDFSWYKKLPADRPHVAYEYINTGSVVENAPNVSSVTAWVGLVQPEGLGNITLGSGNYLDAPVIYGNYYGSPADKAAVLYGYKQLRSIMNSTKLRDVIIEEVYPGNNVTSDADIWKAIQETARSWHHPVGTVAIGSVLDTNWRVKGTKGLRVVGSPAIPYISTCPIMSTVYAVGHRAAVDIAKADGLTGQY